MKRNAYVIGVSAYYHDSAACLLKNGVIIAAAQEERFTRVKHDASFPQHAIKYVCEQEGIEIADVETIVFYEKPFIKFERLLETYHNFAPKGLISFLKAIPVWIKEKLFQKKLLRDELKKLGTFKGTLYFSEHHLSHAASAFYPSPFEEAAILTIDGVGEWATTTISKGSGDNINVIKECHFPHSLGLLYSAFTYFCGFKVNSGEYKLMGLAPYGDPHAEQTKTFISIIKKHLIDCREDGSFVLNLDYFKYHIGLRMIHQKKWETLFEIPLRKEESELTQDYMNLAYAIQNVTEEIVQKLAKTACKETRCENVVLAGGVALNCVANGKLLHNKVVKNLWIQPASGDAGGCVGAALAYWHLNHPNEKRCMIDTEKGSYLGPQYNDRDIEKMIKTYSAVSSQRLSKEEVTKKTADYINNGKVVGWFQGRMEFGPRALGNRSILGDPRNPDMQKKINLKIKYREGFRPFAPAVLEEDSETYFELKGASPYMLLVAPINENRKHKEPKDYTSMDMMKRLYHQRSDLPAITHVDYSARVQTVNKQTNPDFWGLLSEFKKQTGCSALINTSFNVRGEPIVCTPHDAYRCFMNTEMDVLVCGSYIFLKEDQPYWEKEELSLND